MKRSLDRIFLDYRPHGWARALVWLLVAALCVVGFLLHYLTGPDLDYGSVFLLPCIAAAWYLGRNAGFATVAVSAGAWFVASIAQSGSPPVSVVLANTISRFVVFLLLVWVLDALRGLLLRLSKSSMTDVLTGLGNRAAFLDRGQRGMDTANRAALPVSLMFIDLDDFKSVNDSRGHEAGDEVLREVADTLREGIRRSDLAARLGGDEFAVLLVGSDAVAAATVAEKLRERLAQRFLRSGLGVTLSIGIATSPRAKATLETLLSEADRLMYEAKTTGKGAVACHTLDAPAG